MTSRVRSGRRIRVADAEVVQDGVTVARASLVFLRTSATPPVRCGAGPTGSRARRRAARAAAGGQVAPWFGSGDDGPGWTPTMADHQGAGASACGPGCRRWSPTRRVAVHPAAMTGETTSMMTNWGARASATSTPT